MAHKIEEREKFEDKKKVEGTRTPADVKSPSTKKTGTKIEDAKDLPNDQVRLGEPIPTKQDLRKEVRADADSTNPETNDYTVHLEVANTQYEDPKTIEKRTQEELMDNLGRNAELGSVEAIKEDKEEK